MPSFRSPEYKNYLELCEELHLVREWKAGDMFYEHTPANVVSKSGVARVVCWTQDYRYLESDLGRWWFWLPSLADWLEMLEKEGSSYIRISASRGKDEVRWLVDAWSEPDVFSSGVTREEAAGRLWVKVMSLKLKAERDKEQGAKQIKKASVKDKARQQKVKPSPKSREPLARHARG